MVEQLFKKLAWTCFKHGLKFEYTPVTGGIEVYSTEGPYKMVAHGYIKKIDVAPEKELIRLNKEVFEFVNIKDEVAAELENEFTDEEFITSERPRGVSLITLAMLGSGHKESDFE